MMGRRRRNSCSRRRAAGLVWAPTRAMGQVSSLVARAWVGCRQEYEMLKG
jgi:hypothetical protein